MQSTWVQWWMIFIEGIDPLSIPPFFRPKFGCWNNSWEFQFFWVKNIHRLSGFCFEKAGIVFFFSMEIPNQKNGTQFPHQFRWKALSLLCRPIASQPRVSWWSVCRSETFKSPILNVDRTSFCGQSKKATIFFHPCQCGGCFVFSCCVCCL